ncbi:hypothetical protein AB1N83_007553 [Pleurotus pulmonarius]
MGGMAPCVVWVGICPLKNTAHVVSTRVYRSRKEAKYEHAYLLYIAAEWTYHDIFVNEGSRRGLICRHAHYTYFRRTRLLPHGNLWKLEYSNIMHYLLKSKKRYDILTISPRGSRKRITPDHDSPSTSPLPSKKAWNHCDEV